MFNRRAHKEDTEHTEKNLCELRVKLGALCGKKRRES